MNDATQQERLRRWRLVLGGDPDGTGCKLGGEDAKMDAALEALYGDKGQDGQGRPGRGRGKFQYKPGGKAGKREDGEDGERRPSKEGSQPDIARWLGDIREYFPSSVVQVMQRDAIDRLDMKELLLEPELLDQIEPDVHLVADLISLSKVMPSKTRESARLVVRKVTEELTKRLRNPTQQAIMGKLNRAVRNYRPRLNEIDWGRTIRRNLKHYQQDYRTIIPETLIGYGRKRSALRDIILCVDQSGSMGSSVVYSSIFGAVLASLPALKTHMVVYDTAVVDLTSELQDPVDLLFGTMLGGGNDGPRALRYCNGLISRPQESVFVLISDLYETDADERKMLQQISTWQSAGVTVVVLLALSDRGAPSYKSSFASSLADLGIPAFACTPDLFPELMAAAINREDIGGWAARNEIVAAR